MRDRRRRQAHFALQTLSRPMQLADTYSRTYRCFASQRFFKSDSAVDRQGRSGSRWSDDRFPAGSTVDRQATQCGRPRKQEAEMATEKLEKWLATSERREAAKDAIKVWWKTS